MIALKDLSAEFVKLRSGGMLIVETLDEAQGLKLLCPKCYTDKGSKIGAHSVICWFANRGVPDDQNPKPGRWVPTGSGICNLSFVSPAAASVQLLDGCRWHGFIKNGFATVIN